MSYGKASAARSYRTVGRYRVYSELASGGMATVHLGCLIGTAGFSKLVAVKCLHQEFAVEPEFVSMFLDEARLASSINHPNVVASLDVVAEQGELLVVMEYVHGETLAGLLRLSRQRQELAPLPVVVRMVCDALEGLHAAHTASLAGACLNIVHRDVSPQNIMVGADGNTRVLDFGIAQAALRSQVTAAGTVKGKIAYMSPEQLQNRAVDARTDVFAAGVVLWEALTGRRLFFAPDQREAATLLLSSKIAAPSKLNPAVSTELDRVVLRALERDAEQRYQSARDFAEELRASATEGSRRDVASWVNRLAEVELSQRLELLQALEASAIHTQISAVIPRVTASSPQAAPPPEAAHTQATTSTSILPQPSAGKRTRRAPWLFAAAGMLTAVGVWALASRPAAPTVATVAARGVSSAASLTLPRVPNAPTVPTATSEATSVAAPPTPPPSSPAAPSKVLAKKAGPAPRATARAVGRSAACSPPYRIDAAGVRRIKPECL